MEEGGGGEDLSAVGGRELRWSLSEEGEAGESLFPDWVVGAGQGDEEGGDDCGVCVCGGGGGG